MPELPEVETTTTELGKLLPGLKVTNIWTSYNSPYFYGK
ncbi:MAG: formamidopyrimidine-DNA glycosylase, partial [Candidatus Paceibacteria bacterium]